MRTAARVALASYGLESARVRLLSHFCNTTYAVEPAGGGRRALHLYRYIDESIPIDRRSEWIESELWWLEQVRSSLGIASPKPVPNGAGESVTWVEFGREKLPCVLFEWVDGRVVKAGLRPSHMRQVGHLTARLHDMSSGMDVPAFVLRGQVDRLDDPAQAAIVKSFRDFRTSEGAAMARRAIHVVIDAMDRVATSPDVYGLIHADIHHNNFLFHRGEVALIDFGDCGWGHYLYDLAVTLSPLKNHCRAGELRQALFEGYREIRPLSDEHAGLVAVFEILRDMQDLAATIRDRDDPSMARWTEAIGDSYESLRRRVDDQQTGLDPYADRRQP